MTQSPLPLNKNAIEAELVDLSTAARMLGVSRQATYQHIKRGHLESVHAGASSLVFVKQVKALRSRLDSYKNRQPSDKTRPRSKKRMKDLDRIKQTVDQIAQLRFKRDVAVNELKQTLNKHIEAVRDPAQRKKLRGERDRKIREMKRTYVAEINRIRRSIQKPQL